MKYLYLAYLTFFYQFYELHLFLSSFLEGGQPYQFPIHCTIDDAQYIPCWVFLITGLAWDSYLFYIIPRIARILKERRVREMEEVLDAEN